MSANGIAKLVAAWVLVALGAQTAQATGWKRVDQTRGRAISIARRHGLHKSGDRGVQELVRQYSGLAGIRSDQVYFINYRHPDFKRFAQEIGQVPGLVGIGASQNDFDNRPRGFDRFRDKTHPNLVAWREALDGEQGPFAWQTDFIQSVFGARFRDAGKIPSGGRSRHEALDRSHGGARLFALWIGDQSQVAEVGLDAYQMAVAKQQDGRNCGAATTEMLAKLGREGGEHNPFANLSPLSEYRLGSQALPHVLNHAGPRRLPDLIVVADDEDRN